MSPSWRLLAKKAVAGFLYHSRVIDMLPNSRSGHRFILAYHRVLSGNSEDLSFVQPGMFVTGDTFEMHIRHLLAHYDVVPLDDLITRNEGNACAITFDDGWRDNYLNAYPILRAHRVPATIFLATNLVGTTRWPWPDRICFYIHRASPAAFTAALRSAWRSETGQPLDIAVPSADPFAAAEDVLRRLKRLEHAMLERVVASIDADVHEPGVHPARPASLADVGGSGGDERPRHLLRLAHGKPRDTHERLDVGCSSGGSELRKGDFDEAWTAGHGLLLPERRRTTPRPCGIVAEAGYQCAVTTKSGPLERSTGPFELTRILLHDDISSTRPLFACTLAGWSGFRRTMPARLEKTRVKSDRTGRTLTPGCQPPQRRCGGVHSTSPTTRRAWRGCPPRSGPGCSANSRMPCAIDSGVFWTKIARSKYSRRTDESDVIRAFPAASAS